MREQVAHSATYTDPELRAILVEEYSSEEKPSDGEIYRKVRHYERTGNVAFKKRWKARLSDHGRRSLRQLLDHGDGELAAGFDGLLGIPGLWDDKKRGMRLSTVHKMIGMRCDEVGLPASTSSFAHAFDRRFYIISNTLGTSGTGFFEATGLPS